MTTDELDALLLDRFNLSRTDLISALKTLPPQEPWPALSTAEADLLTAADFGDDAASVARSAANAIVTIAQLMKSAYTASEVAAGLGLDTSDVEQRRQARTLWAIEDGRSWVYPAAQFETLDLDRHRGLQTVRGLTEVLPALSRGMHPAAVAGLLLTPQNDLAVDGQPHAAVDWLHQGGPVDAVLRLIDSSEWASR